MIDVIYNKAEQRSVALDQGVEIGECTYADDGQTWVINHTFVNPQYGGQGIAKRLVDLLIHEARLAGVRVTATCSYALHLFSKTPDYHDVVVSSSKKD